MVGRSVRFFFQASSNIGDGELILIGAGGAQQQRREQSDDDYYGYTDDHNEVHLPLSTLTRSNNSYWVAI